MSSNGDNLDSALKLVSNNCFTITILIHIDISQRQGLWFARDELPKPHEIIVWLFVPCETNAM